jgi:hypothetical protein
MNDARSANCSGHGVGADGGCRVVVSKRSRFRAPPGDDTGDTGAQKPDDIPSVSFVCECADGYEGEACETQTSVGAVAGADAGVRAERKKEISSAGAVAASDARGAPEEAEEEDGETARAALAVTGVIILCVAVVLVVVSLIAVRRAARKDRARREVERHIQNAGL